MVIVLIIEHELRHEPDPLLRKGEHMSDSGKNTTIIGAFVVGAIILAVAGVIVFGGGNLFTHTYRYIIFFDGSVKGLNVGAPVVFRGVKIGQVTSVRVVADPQNWEISIPVEIEIDPKIIENSRPVTKDYAENLQDLVDKGLRARLNIQSLVTGQLLVELEYLPDQEPRFSGTKPDLPEIPSVPSTFERIAKTLEQLPISEIFNKLADTLDSANTLLKKPTLSESIDNFNQAAINAGDLLADLDNGAASLMKSVQRTVDNIDQLVEDADGTLDSLSGDVEATLASATAALNQLNRFLTLEYGEPARLAESFRKAADSVPPALNEANIALKNISTITGRDSPDRRMLERMLQELSDAARSIRIWAEYLERHPEALITGKRGSPRR
jgi:paraquat-inducible protein B